MRNSASLTAVRCRVDVARSATHEAIAVLSVGRINPYRTFVSNTGTAVAAVKTRRLAHRSARRQFAFDATVGCEAFVDEGSQILRLGLSADRLAQNPPRPCFHRMSIARRTRAQSPHYAVVRVTDRGARRVRARRSPHGSGPHAVMAKQSDGRPPIRDMLRADAPQPAGGDCASAIGECSAGPDKLQRRCLDRDGAASDDPVYPAPHRGDETAREARPLHACRDGRGNGRKAAGAGTPGSRQTAGGNEYTAAATTGRAALRGGADYSTLNPMVGLPRSRGDHPTSEPESTLGSLPTIDRGPRGRQSARSLFSCVGARSDGPQVRVRRGHPDRAPAGPGASNLVSISRPTAFAAIALVC